MKNLIVYYSRTGTTKKVAEALAEKTQGEVVAINDNIDRSGPLGWLKSGKEGGAKKVISIDDINKNISDYDLVILGTPVWAGNMSSPVRSFIENKKDKIKKIAFFTTQGSSKEQKVFKEVNDLFGNNLVAIELFSTKEVKQGDFEERLNGFISKFI